MIRSGTTSTGVHYEIADRADGRIAYKVERPGVYTEAGSEATKAAAIEAVCACVKQREART